MIVYTHASELLELEGILSLQKKNLLEPHSPEEKRTEGFITVRHDLRLLKEMNDTCPHIIATDKGKVIGYALCMHPKFKKEIPLLQPMFSEIKKCIARNDMGITMENYMVMGQICIDKAYRKQGIFRKLYETMQHSLPPGFTTIITEIDTENLRSLTAHYAIGFENLSVYSSGGQDWQLIYLK